MVLLIAVVLKLDFVGLKILPHSERKDFDHVWILTGYLNAMQWTDSREEF